MKYFAIIFITLISRAASSSTGANACPEGEPAPGGPHLAAIPWFFGALTEGDYVVYVAGKPLSYRGEPVDVPLDFDVEVRAEGMEFKGILIRVGGTTADQVTSPDLTSPALSCGDVGSVTHSDASLKKSGLASVSLDEPQQLFVDISVVVGNSDGFSAFFFSSFRLNAVRGLTQEVETPEDDATTDAPAMSVTDATSVDAISASHTRSMVALSATFLSMLTFFL